MPPAPYPTAESGYSSDSYTPTDFVEKDGDLVAVPEAQQHEQHY